MTCPRPIREPRRRGKVPRKRKSTAVAASSNESPEWLHCRGRENLFAAVLWSLFILVALSAQFPETSRMMGQLAARPVLNFIYVG